MWLLKGPKDEVYYLLPGKHVIGRKNCNLVLDNDQSISRIHAIIEVSHPQSSWTNPSEKPTLNFYDAGSKYGTSLITGSNTMKMRKDIKKNLEEGVVIQFGLQFNKWQLNYEPLIVVVSSLPKAEKHKLRDAIGELGGHMVSDWHKETTHLTMANVTMTIKAISALAQAKPIVTPAYWHSYIMAIKSKAELPKCEDYVPPSGETVLNEHEVSFLVNPKRKSLFHGKIFYFFSEIQFRDHGCMVQAAGGIAKLVKAVRRSQLTQFVEKNAVAMQLLSTSSQTMTLSQSPEVFTEVSDFLRLNNKRLIPASEIGLAVLHCSVEKYCNPDFNFSSMLLRGSQTSRVVHDRILATETQDTSGPSLPIIGDRKVIPDSGSESKVGLSLTLEEKTATSSTQKLVQDTQLSMQLKMEASQSPTQEQSINSFPARSSKRLRMIEETDDEVEILPPRKLIAGTRNIKNMTPVIKEEENSDDLEVSTVVSPLASRRRASSLNTSSVSHQNEDGDNLDELFAGFKEPQLKAGKSSKGHREPSPDVNADDLFADFQDDGRTSAAQTPVRPTSSSKTVFPVSPACKRNLPSNDESGPPEKRFAKLDLSQQSNDEDRNSAECIQFMATSNVKVEDDTSNMKHSGNVSVVFKNLMSRNTTVPIVEKAHEHESGVANYKKFRKVNPLSNSVIPNIIGGRDLEIYESGNSSALKDLNDQDNESEEEDGPNSLWETLTQSNRKQNQGRKL